MKTAIITVNFNSGERLLQTVESLFAQTEFREADYFIVDNGATDGSTAPVQAKFPKINYSFTGENLGFGRGHNAVLADILAGKYGEYEAVCLVNPDMLLTAGWLETMQAVLAADEQVAAVNPLILYADKFNVLAAQTTNSKIYLQHEDYRTLGNAIGKEDSQTKEIILNNQPFIQLNQAEFLILLDEKLPELKLTVYDESLQGYELTVGGQVCSSGRASSLFKKIGFKFGKKDLSTKQHEFCFPVRELKFKQQGVEVVNSLGSGIRPGRQLPDNHYFGALRAEVPDQAHEVQLFHGACVLIRTSALKQVGLFDPGYFLYYEESDLAMRMRAAGFKVMAQPKAVVYHLERGARSERTLEFMQTSQKLFIKKWGSGLFVPARAAWRS